jgi:hypothetical protein
MSQLLDIFSFLSEAFLMTTALTRAERPYDPADLSSLEFWSGTAKDREKVFAELRAVRPFSWHRPV